MRMAMNRSFGISRILLSLVASSMILQCHLTAWGAQASRFGPARNLQRAKPPTATPNNIMMASNAVLKASIRAARLCELAYPETVLSDADSLASYSDPAKFQQYAAALKNALKGLTSYDLLFVQRLSFAPLSPLSGSRFLYAFIMPTKTAVYVAFRGTDTLGGDSFFPSVNARASLGADGSSVQMSIQGNSPIKVHSGFWNSLTDASSFMYDSTKYRTTISAYAEIKDAIFQAQLSVGGTVPVILTGHSLGAAEAALTAYKLTLDTKYDVTLYTFGMPQVGNKAWRDAFDAALGKNHYRWWNMQDPVPQFPNAYADPNCYPSLGCNQTWWTVDNLYRIDAVPRGALRCGLPSGNYSICDTRDTTPPPQNSQSCYATVSYLDYWTTADHSIITYKNNLKTCRNSTLAG